MDAVPSLPPDLPPHDPAPLRSVPSDILVQWPPGTFVENLVVHGDAAIVSILSGARLDRVGAAGPLGNARSLEPMAMLLVRLASVEGMGPRLAVALLRDPAPAA